MYKEKYLIEEIKKKIRDQREKWLSLSVDNSYKSILIFYTDCLLYTFELNKLEGLSAPPEES